MSFFFLYLNQDWPQQVLQLTAGHGVDVTFDSVGSTLKQSFEVTREGGHVVFYGMSGGDPEPVDPRYLMDTSKTLTGGDLWHFLNSHQSRLDRSHNLFDQIRNEHIKLREPVKFLLSDGRTAHEYLESGNSASKVLLIPEHD